MRSTSFVVLIFFQARPRAFKRGQKVSIASSQFFLEDFFLSFVHVRLLFRTKFGIMISNKRSRKKWIKCMTTAMSRTVIFMIDNKSFFS